MFTIAVSRRAACDSLPISSSNADVRVLDKRTVACPASLMVSSRGGGRAGPPSGSSGGGCVGRCMDQRDEPPAPAPCFLGFLAPAETLPGSACVLPGHLLLASALPASILPALVDGGVLSTPGSVGAGGLSIVAAPSTSAGPAAARAASSRSRSTRTTSLAAAISPSSRSASARAGTAPSAGSSRLGSSTGAEISRTLGAAAVSPRSYLRALLAGQTCSPATDLFRRRAASNISAVTFIATRHKKRGGEHQ